MKGAAAPVVVVCCLLFCCCCLLVLVLVVVVVVVVARHLGLHHKPHFVGNTSQHEVTNLPASSKPEGYATLHTDVRTTPWLPRCFSSPVIFLPPLSSPVAVLLNLSIK